MNLRLLALAATTSLLSACVVMQPVNIAAPFDTKEASIINKTGNNAITGSALIKRNDGQTVTCSGEEVTLLPYTAYTSARIGAIYGNNSKGMSRAPKREFIPDPAEYMTMRKNTTCNAQGFFSFKNLADGEYFVVTVVKWTVDYSVQGGALMRRVAVKGGETTEIVLAP